MVISSYLPEILQISDRILVCRQGRIVEEFEGHKADEETIMPKLDTAQRLGLPVDAPKPAYVPSQTLANSPQYFWSGRCAFLRPVCAGCAAARP